MTTSTSFAQMANKQSLSLSSALRANTPPTKGQTTSRKCLTLSIFFRLLLVMFLTLTVSAEAWSETIASWTGAKRAANTEYAPSTSQTDNSTAKLKSECALSTAGEGASAGSYYGTWTNGKCIYVTGLNLSSYKDVSLTVYLRRRNATCTASFYTSTDGSTYAATALGTKTLTNTLTSYSISGIGSNVKAIKILITGGGGNLWLGTLSVEGTKAAVATELDKPTNLSSNVETTSAILSWNSVTNASGYIVTIVDGGNFKEDYTADTNSLTVTNLSPSTDYLWTVKAVGDGTNYTDSEESEIGEFATLASCDKKVKVEKGSPSGGSFSISKTGTYETCDEDLVITLSNITPYAGYQFGEITQSGINTGVTIDKENKKVTYAQNTSGTSTINVTFNALPTHTVTWIVNGNEYTEGTPTASVYEGAKWSSLTLPTAPNPNDYCGQVFAGWTTTNIGSTGLDKDNDATAIQNLNLMTSENKSSKTNTITGDITFYAVFADYAN